MTAATARAIVAAALLALAPCAARAGDAGEATLAELAGFVIGAPLDAGTRARLASIAAEEARRDPAAAARSRSEIEALLPTLRRLETGAARASARGSIVAALHWGAARTPDPASGLILEKAGVVAADPETRAVVRRADLDGFCRSVRLAADATRVGFDPDGCRRAATEAADRLASFPPADRELIAAGERRAATLEEHWGSLGAAQRSAMLDGAKRRAGSQDPLRLARPLETAALSARLAARLERFGDAAAEGLAAGAAASAIGAAGRGS